MGMIYKEIDNDNADLKKIRTEIENLADVEKKNSKIDEAGKMVENNLTNKKLNETGKIIDAFRKSVFEYKLNKTNGDAMFMNTAILMNSGREVEFDNIMAEIGVRFQDRSDFVYTAPLPIFNFIDLKIFPEKWEL